jgi:hypothetical protein
MLFSPESLLWVCLQSPLVHLFFLSYRQCFLFSLPILHSNVFLLLLLLSGTEGHKLNPFTTPSVPFLGGWEFPEPWRFRWSSELHEAGAHCSYFPWTLVGARLQNILCGTMPPQLYSIQVREEEVLTKTSHLGLEATSKGGWLLHPICACFIPFFPLFSPLTLDPSCFCSCSWHNHLCFLGNDLYQPYKQPYYYNAQKRWNWCSEILSGFPWEPSPRCHKPPSSYCCRSTPGCLRGTTPLN